MTLPSLPIRGAWPTSRPAADLTPAAALTWDSTDGGQRRGVLVARAGTRRSCAGLTAASTFLAPAAKLLK